MRSTVTSRSIRREVVTRRVTASLAGHFCRASTSTRRACYGDDVVDPHRLAELRSLAYHREIAVRLLDVPGDLAPVRARVEGWLRDGSVARTYAAGWAEVLARPVTHLAYAEFAPSGRRFAFCTALSGADPGYGVFIRNVLDAASI